MEIINKSIKDIKPYEKNPRKNKDAVDYVAKSIEEFGFKNPIIIDRNNTIVCGHTRLLAAKKLKLKEVPCIIADDLTEEQIKAFRLADNKVSEFAEWDFDLLNGELDNILDIDMSDFGFELSELNTKDWFETHERNDTSRQDGNDEYNEFLDKFEVKKTTDDCYTPDIVYNAIAEWVVKEYELNKKDFVRPFKPNGDYQNEKYKSTDVVVDNPPFSILSDIVKWYTDNNIRFFLFGPTNTIFSSSASANACTLPCGGEITYENGAVVPTSFITNLEDNRIRVAPDLYQVIDEANTKNQAQFKRTLPKYKYPNEVITAAMCRYMCTHGIPLVISKKDSYHIKQLDAQKELDGSTIFGSGFLLSEKAAAEKAAAEKVNAIVWKLSDREKEIIRNLG